MRVRLRYKPKPNSYTESRAIDVAGRWRERNVWYPGRSAWNASKGVTAAQGKRGGAERAEVSRGHSRDVPEEMKARKPKGRISRSLKYDRERRNDRNGRKH